METAFVDDTILQDAVALKAQIALDMCAMWVRKSGMHWNLGKSFVMLQAVCAHQPVVSTARESNYR
jgi:hypothetical protein